MHYLHECPVSRNSVSIISIYFHIGTNLLGFSLTLTLITKQPTIFLCKKVLKQFFVDEVNNNHFLKMLNLYINTYLHVFTLKFIPNEYYSYFQFFIHYKFLKTTDDYIYIIILFYYYAYHS